MEITNEKQLAQQPSPQKSFFDVFTIKDCEDDMLHDLRNGLEKGTTTYNKEFDNAWTWRRGEVNLVTGMANEGKSLYLKQLCMMKYLAEGCKFVFCSPEDAPPKNFFDDLVHTLSGKSTDIGRLGSIREEEYIACVNRISDGFKFLHIKPPLNTVTAVMEAFRKLKEKDPQIVGIVIDPIMKFSREPEAPVRDDLFAGYIAMNVTEVTRELNISTFIVMHQLTPKKNEKGFYDKPSGYSIKSGGSWMDGVDNVLYVWRPYYAKDKLDPTVWVGSLKIKKQKLVGIPQDVELSFDRKTNRYITKDGRDFFNFDAYKMK